MKKCFKCLETKTIESFYKHPQMPDGHVNKCIKCAKKESSERLKIKMEDPVFVEKEKARCLEKDRRLYRKSLKPFNERVKGENKEIWKNHRDKYPEKYLARILSKNFHSKIKGFEMHHWNYNREFATDLIELSKKDHYKAHRFLIYHQDLKIYKTIDNVMLTTKDEHIQYLKQIGIVIK